MNNIRTYIMEEIRKGELMMRPRWHFVLKATLYAFSSLLALILTLYFFSFTLFILARSGVLFAPQFGSKGIWLLLMTSPWLIMSLACASLLILVILITHYSFSYRRPLILSFCGAVVLVLFLSFFMQYVAFHEKARSFLDRHHVPGMTPLYRSYGDARHERVFPGKISSILPQGFEIELRDGAYLAVTMTPHTRISPSVLLQAGEMVLVFGDRHDSKIEAFGVRRLPPPVPFDSMHQRDMRDDERPW